MAFSPQSDKLAIAQSDNMVFVYKIGNDWGEKKSICNKFQHPSSTTSLIWPVKRPNELLFGIAEGQVRAGNLKSHKTTTLYSSESYVTSMAGNMESNGFVSGHIDGSIFIYYFDNADRGARLIVRHPCPPFALAWGQSIVVGSNEGRVYFYDTDGTEEQMLDVTDRGTNFQETSAAVCNPTGDVVVLGGFDALLTVVKNKDSMSWDVDAVTTVENMYSVTTMDWKPDGDRLAVGNVCGVVNLYDISIKRALYKGGFELTYVSVSQVIVRQLESNLRIVLRSQYGREITKTNIYQGRYVVAHTSDTILLGDLETLKLSEIAWQGGSNEKFIFDNAAACIIFAAGEATIVEYGIDDILGSVRTSYVSSHVISLRINERVMRPTASGPVNTNAVENKKVAYLLDAQTICVRDLVTQSVVQIPHDSKIDWLELNARADVLLFRDKKRYLHMFNVTTQVRCQLLNFCTYVQWVPGSDVIVAQNRSSLCVWYNVSAPDQITSIPIKGDVEDIERAEGRTEVIVDEGLSQAVYPLDESLISFSTALDDAEFFRAMDILEKLVLSPDVEAMWRQLKIVALKAGEVRVAQRCCAALGNVPLSQYLGQIIAIGKKAETDFGIHSADHYQVRCKLALLKKDFDAAEHILVNQGKVEECIAMYQKFHRYDEAIRVAQENKHPDLLDMRRTYFQLLLDTNQHERAAMLKVVECDFAQAINLFLKGGMPGKAAQVIIDNNIMQPLQLLDSVATSLTRAGMHDKAGEFYERLNELPRALDSYVRGNAYRKAVDLARKCFPARVVELQEAWGDYLVSIKQVDMAINHYIEAKVNRKAIEAAVSARQFSRALQLVDAIDKDSARPYYRQLARHYEDGRQYDLAERCYVAADQAHSAVEMHTKLGNWDMAHSIARKYMKEEDVGMLYISQGQKMEAKGRLKDAEKLYLAVKEPRLAINMYKKHKRYEDMIRLVQEHHPEMLKETHKFLANTYEMEGSFRDAEHHHVEAQEWHAAVNMYRFNEQWDDAIRVAKFHGGIGACKRVTLAILTAAGVPEGSKYLTKHGLVEAAIDYAAETGAFDLATDLATQLLPKKLPDVYLKYALLLEDDEKYDQAEEQFLRAGKPKEAIEMFIHVSDWKSALRVAENHDSSAIPTVYVAHATERVAAKAYGEAEDLYLAASKPEQALAMYQDAEMWQDAIRIAQKHLPHRTAELNSMYHSAQARAGKGSSKTDFVAVGRQLEQSRQWGQAIDVYLSARAGKVDAAVEVEELWERAVEIARANVPNRYVEVASDVARRLVEIKREEAAADTLFEAGRQDEAIQLLINSKKFDKARALAKGNSQFKKRVDDAYQSFLITKEDTKELAELGHSEEAIELLAKRGDWNRVWELLSKQSIASTTVAKYVLQRVDEVRHIYFVVLCSNNNVLCFSSFVMEILHRWRKQ